MFLILLHAALLAMFCFYNATFTCYHYANTASFGRHTMIISYVYTLQKSSWYTVHACKVNVLSSVRRLKL